MVHTSPIRGDFPSLKLGRMVRYHSTIERDYLYFLEFCQDVVWYKEQPMTIKKLMPDGHYRSYKPDYEVHTRDTKLLVECKPEEKLHSTQAKRQRKIGQHWAEENNHSFLTVTDTNLRSGNTLSNLKLLWRYARFQTNPVKEQIFYVVRSEGAISVNRLSHFLECELRVVVPAVCHLLFHHHLLMDLHEIFDLETTVRIHEGNCHESCESRTGCSLYLSR